MPARVITLIQGPSVEQLDLWGNLDALLWSLDSDIWPEAELCLLDISGKVTSTTLCQMGIDPVTAICEARIHTPSTCEGRVNQSVHCETRIRIIPEECGASVRIIAEGPANIITSVVCEAELRGHNWTLIPVGPAVWTPRDL